MIAFLASLFAPTEQVYLDGFGFWKVVHHHFLSGLSVVVGALLALLCIIGFLRLQPWSRSYRRMNRDRG